MDLVLRTDVGALFEEKSAKYGLEDITYGSFSANFGFRHKFCAADVVYACMALMEQHLDSNSGEFLLLRVQSGKTQVKIKASENSRIKSLIRDLLEPVKLLYNMLLQRMSLKILIPVFLNALFSSYFNG